jgi:hypothetical protein
MLFAIMIGAIVITFFAADIVNRSKIEQLTTEHVVEIEDINAKNENFTNYCLQGSITMDSAREIREVGNYYFDFALFWYNNALKNVNSSFIQQCVDNCTAAMEKYLASYESFGKSKPYFETAETYIKNESRYLRYSAILSYYIGFAEAGQNITLLRYNASNYLKSAAENLSLGNMENLTMLMENFNQTLILYQQGLQGYTDFKNKVDGYLFFDEIREEH